MPDFIGSIARMGRESVELKVVASVSRHNSPKDDEHDALWAELHDRIQAIVEEPKYEPIIAMMF